MIIQLISVSTIYFAFYLPYVIVFITQSFGVTILNNDDTGWYIVALAYIPGFLLPYVNLFALSQLKSKLRALLFWRAQPRGTVVPLAK
ncbi:hypothetical protein I4U23_004252 [Adineta vaga]|nr:hypothetical protein I4U23_004252 [Adineta vaga]